MDGCMSEKIEVTQVMVDAASGVIEQLINRLYDGWTTPDEAAEDILEAALAAVDQDAKKPKRKPTAAAIARRAVARINEESARALRLTALKIQAAENAARAASEKTNSNARATADALAEIEKLRQRVKALERQCVSYPAHGAAWSNAQVSDINSYNREYIQNMKQNQFANAFGSIATRKPHGGDQ